MRAGSRSQLPCFPDPLGEEGVLHQRQRRVEGPSSWKKSRADHETLVAMGASGAVQAGLGGVVAVGERAGSREVELQGEVAGNPGRLRRGLRPERRAPF